MFIGYFTRPRTPPHFSRSGGLSKYSTEILDEKYSTTFWGLPVTIVRICDFIPILVTRFASRQQSDAVPSSLLDQVVWSAKAQLAVSAGGGKV